MPVDTIEFEIPVETVSLTNAHEHWSERARRAREHRTAARLLCSSAISRTFVDELLARGGVVSLTRRARRELDSDNLPPSMKSVRDGIADALGDDAGASARRSRTRASSSTSRPRSPGSSSRETAVTSSSGNTRDLFAQPVQQREVGREQLALRPA